jgi:protein-tyrosine-phosphatase
MAEGFARTIGGGRVGAYSAGSRASGKVDPRAIAVMKEKGIDLGAANSKSLDSLPDQRWDYVVTMGCGDACPHLPAKHRVDWDLPDPKTLDDAGYRSVRDQIEKLVRGLVEEAQKAS